MRMQLNDKVIIITGGCQGLGRSMAEYFAGKGAKLHWSTSIRKTR
jgi:3-oxoacyl-[acyl-carrier protein] reductase